MGGGRHAMVPARCIMDGSAMWAGRNEYALQRGWYKHGRGQRKGSGAKFATGAEQGSGPRMDVRWQRGGTGRPRLAAHK